MKSLLLTILSRGLFWVLCIVALYMLFRGHNEPGGGFIGGLVAATAFALAAKGMGEEHAKKLLLVSPLTLVVLGFLAAIASGAIALLNASPLPYMSGQWGEVFGIKVSNVMLFDIGVFLTVVGGTLTFLFSLENQEG